MKIPLITQAEYEDTSISIKGTRSPSTTISQSKYKILSKFTKISSTNNLANAYSLYQKLAYFLNWWQSTLTKEICTQNFLQEPRIFFLFISEIQESKT